MYFNAVGSNLLTNQQLPSRDETYRIEYSFGFLVIGKFRLSKPTDTKKASKNFKPSLFPRLYYLLNCEVSPQKIEFYACIFVPLLLCRAGPGRIVRCDQEPARQGRERPAAGGHAAEH